MEKIETRYWKVANTTYDELLSEMGEWVASYAGSTSSAQLPRLVCFCDGNGMPKAYFNDKELRAAYAEAEVVCPDGVSVKYLAKIDGGKLPRSVIGPNLFWRAMEYGVSRGWRHYFYGASEETLAKLKAKVEAEFPGVRIVGTFSPEYAPDPEPPAEVKRGDRSGSGTETAEGGCDCFWVALGCPKQEKWSARHLGELKAAVVLPVGAAFDFHAGTAPKTPDWIVRAGFCWLWRMLTGGPRVLWRNAKCVSLALLAIVVEKVRRR